MNMQKPEPLPFTIPIKYYKLKRLRTLQETDLQILDLQILDLQILDQQILFFNSRWFTKGDRKENHT